MTNETRTLAVLAVLKEKGAMDHLTLERRLALHNLSRDLSYLEQAHLIAGATRPGRARVFNITSQGYERLRGQRPVYSAVYAPYVPPPPAYLRPGAEDALRLPSRGFPT